MQDKDAPPVEEGEIDGGAADVREVEHRAAAVVGPAATNSTPTFLPLPWITAIVRPWQPATTTVRAHACGPAAPARADTATVIWSRCPRAKTPTRGSLRLWMTCSFKQRFRKPRRSSATSDTLQATSLRFQLGEWKCTSCRELVATPSTVAGRKRQVFNV